LSRKDGSVFLLDIPDVEGDDSGGDAGASELDEITILFVDDERQLLSVLSSKLPEDIEDLDIVTASNATETLDRLEKLDIDCIVSGYKMPGVDGLELLERSREIAPNIPFILLTSKGSEDNASKAINADVTDYLRKEFSGEQLSLLSNRIENAVAERRAHEAVEETITHLRRIHDRVSDADLGLDEEFRITYLDEDASTLLPDDRDLLVGERLWDVLPEAVDSPLQTEFQQALQADTTVELESYYEPFDTWFDVRAFPADGGLSVYFRDITGRKDREATLEQVGEAVAEMEEHTRELVELAERTLAVYDGEETDAVDTEAELLAGLKKLEGGLDTLRSMAAPDAEDD
jgi:CheY-like chemotaxis protein